MKRNRKKLAPTVFASLKKKIEMKSGALTHKLQKEKDDLKRLAIQGKIQAIGLSIILEELKHLSNKEWTDLMEELIEPTIKQHGQVIKQLDILALRQAKNPAEYKKYEKAKKVASQINTQFSDVIEKARLNKKQFERFFVLVASQILVNNVEGLQNSLAFYEFFMAVEIVKRRFGADQNWLVFMSLIQLRENIIKKKITELGGDYRDDESIKLLSSKLARLVKEKEKRDVSLALIMSDGIKNARDIMSHEGYKYAVSKQDLQKLYVEIAALETALYPDSMQLDNQPR